MPRNTRNTKQDHKEAEEVAAQVHQDPLEEMEEHDVEASHVIEQGMEPETQQVETTTTQVQEKQGQTDFNSLIAYLQKLGVKLEAKMDENKKENREELEQITGKLQNIIDRSVSNLRQDIKKNIEIMEEKNKKWMEEQEAKAKKLEEKIHRKMEEEIEKVKEEVDYVKSDLQIVKEDNKEFQIDMEKKIERKIGETTEETRRMLGGTIEEVKKDMERQEEAVRTIRFKVEEYGRGMVPTQGGTQKIIYVGQEGSTKFDGNIRTMHPKVFIKLIRNKVRGLYDLEEVKEVIRMHMTGNAILWFAAKEEEFKDLKDIENKLVKYFWGESQQALFRERLYFSKYYEEGRVSMSAYAMQLYNIAQHLEPRMEEQEIVLYIARHFNDQIAETVAMQDLKTLEQLTTYLIRVERSHRYNQNKNYNRKGTNTYNEKGYGNSQQKYSESRYNGRNQNTSRNRSDWYRGRNYPSNNNYNYPNRSSDNSRQQTEYRNTKQNDTQQNQARVNNVQLKATAPEYMPQEQNFQQRTSQ